MAVISGNGRVLGTEVADEIIGGNGSDTLLGGAGNDTLNGGFDVDFAEYSTSPFPIEALLSSGIVSRDGTGGTDTLIGIEGVIGSLNADVIVGSAQADVLIGLTGADTMDGGGGDDLLRGNEGDDQITGGEGIDNAFYSGGRADYAVTAIGGGFLVRDTRATAANDGTDTVTQVEYFVFDDVLLAAEEVVNPAGNRPTAGSDSLFGGARADRIDALAGDDTVNAGGGDDTLIGGLGNDVLDGGAGFDTALFGAAGFRGANPSQSSGGLLLTTATGADTLANVESALFADGRLVLDASDPAARVARLYEAALDRLPDQAGLNFWTAAVQAGEPLSSLASGFLASPEFRARFGDFADAGAFVDRLYLNVLGRAGEPDGRAFWVDTLDRGSATRADVLAAFSESAENKAGTAALVRDGIWDRSETAAQVARLYDTVFGRLPDAPGLVAWRDALDSGRATTLVQVADAFAGSAEFQARYGALDNRGFANALYVNTLDRTADQAGLDFWTAALDTGTPRSVVVLAFSESAEHVNLTANNIQSEDISQFGILFA